MLMVRAHTADRGCMPRIARLALVVLSAAAFAALPALAQAGPHHRNACAKAVVKHHPALARRCAKEHAAARRRNGAAPTVHSVPAAVVAQCKAELLADPAAFAAKYANKDGHEALGHCIKANLPAAGTDPADGDATPAPDHASPAAACAAEKAADPAAFQTKYDANGHEAFGHCVRQHAHDSAAGDETTAPADDTADQGDTPDDPATDDTSDDSADSAPADDGSGGGSVDYGVIFG
jgi:hypothetical protein